VISFHDKKQGIKTDVFNFEDDRKKIKTQRFKFPNMGQELNMGQHEVLSKGYLTVSAVNKLKDAP
jgi:hypothetical protein